MEKNIINIKNAEIEETIYTEEEIEDLELSDKEKEIIKEIINERKISKNRELISILSNTTCDLIDEFEEEYNLEDDIAIEYLIIKGIKAIYNE